jgi:type II secretory pathway pseudopilin PulG
LDRGTDKIKCHRSGLALDKTLKDAQYFSVNQRKSASTAFTPLEKAAEFIRRLSPLKADGGITGFTLIELLIAISISIMITAALYFSLRTAFESWDVSQDMLILQQVSSRTMEELTEGLPGGFGLRDALEIVNGDSDYITVVMPYSDDTQRIYSGVYTYSLNRHIKPGTSIPIAEALLPEQKSYCLIPIALLDKGKSDDYPQVFIQTALPSGSGLRFTFHPDYKTDGDIVADTYRYDSSEQGIFVENKDGLRNISKNPFGVKITDFSFRYFDNANTEAGSVSAGGAASVSGIEISFTAASKNGNIRQTKTFISLRNAPAHSGNFALREGAVIPIPDSKNIKAFFLANLYGIDNKDELILKASSDKGQEWLLTIKFSKISMLSPPVIEQYAIEYPQGNKVYSDNPRSSAESGLNLLFLGPSGLYDYDDDEAGDNVILEGRVRLEVKKMDIGGASVFVRP